MAKTKLQIIEESIESILKNKPVQEPQETVVEEVEVDIPQEQKTKNGGEDKKLLKGAGYVGEKLGLGLLRSVEGIADFAVGGLADLFGGDEVAENLMKNDWINYSHADEWYDPGKGMSFVGDVVGGVGGLLPAVAVSWIPGVGQAAAAAISTGIFTAGAAGQATSEAVKQSGTLGGKEWLYGTASGALEGGIEALSGGIGGTAAGKVLGKQLGKSTLGKIGMTVAGEGLEEVASDIANPLLKRATGVDKNAEMPTLGELGRTFAVGGTIGSVMGGGRQLIGAARSGGFNNYTAGQTAEQLTERQAYANLRQAKGKGTVYTAKDINKTAQSLSNRLQKMTSAEREAFMVRNANIAPLFNADGTLVEANTVANLDASVKTEANTPTSSGQSNQNAVASGGSYNRNAYSASLRGRESTFKYKPISTTSAVSNTARTVMNTLTKLSKGKSNIVLTDEAITTESGEKANALYKDGIIYLDANATDYQKALAVGVHEVIHGIEGTKEYNKLADFVAEIISNNPELQKRYNVEAYRDIYDAILEGDYSEITKNYQATTEMFADFLGNEVANNEGTLNRLLLKDRNIIVRLWEWVKDAISKLGMTKGEREARKGLEKLEKLLSNALEAGRGGRSLEDVEKTARAAEKAHLEDELKKKKAAQAEETEGAVAQAEETAETIDNQDRGVQVLTEDQAIKRGVIDKKSGTVRYNLFTFEEGGGKQLLEKNLKKNGFTQSEINETVKTMTDMAEYFRMLEADVNGLIDWNSAKVIYDEKTGQSVFSALVNNGDYPLNIDLSTICKKRVAITKVLNTLVRRNLIDSVSLSPENIVKINKILKENNYEVACPACFVETKRYRTQEWANQFTDVWNNIIQQVVQNPKSLNFAQGKYLVDAGAIDIQKLQNIIDTTEKRENRKIAETIRDNPQLRGLLPTADLIGSVGLKAIKQHAFPLYTRILNKAGSATPKIVQEVIPYNSELGGYKDLAKEAKTVGGVRMFSFSDFTVLQTFDYLQVIADLASQKATMHTYTKEIAFAELFGQTGIKINLSLIPEIDSSLGKENAGLDANGNLIWSKQWGVDYNKAKALMQKEGYNGNVGTATIGVSDNHILKLLDDPVTNYIIPYHESGINPIVKKQTKIDKYNDYTKVQSTRNADGKNLSPGEAKKFNFFKVLEKEQDARKMADKYLAWCKENNYIPKFEKFAFHKNYYKLLVDFQVYKTVNGEEVYAPQSEVTLTFPDNFKNILKDELLKQQAISDRNDARFDETMQEIVKAISKNSATPTKKADIRYSLNTIDVYSAKQIDTVIDDITDMFIEMSGIDTNVYNVDIRGKKAIAKQFADLLNSKAAFSTKSVSERANGLVDKILGNVRITNADASGVAEAENTVEFMRKYFHSMNLASVKSDINNESNYRLFSGGKEAMAWDSVLQEIVEFHPEYEQGSDIETLLHVMDEYNRAKKLIAEQTVQLSKVVKDLDFVKTMMTQQLTTSLERDKTTYKKVTPKNEEKPQEKVRKVPANTVENLSAEELAKKTSDRVQTIVKDKGVIRQTISDIREGKKSVKETWDEILEELKYGERARWIEVQIALTDKQAGIAKAAHNLGININGEIQRARAAKAAAVNMLTYKQTDFAGNVIGESLRDIFDPIQKKGEQYAKNFNEYLLHQLNIARMSVVDNAKAEIEKLYKANPNLKTVVEEKYETEAKWRKAVTDEQGGEEYLRLANSENKPVFQQEVTAEFSKERLAELDKQHPTFKETAEKVWKYNKNLLQYRVDAGLITQAQADQMNKMYPHYVPAFYDKTNVARTGVSGGKNRVAVRTGIKSAKGSGGKADIIDVSLAISRQTESVVRAAAINKVVAKLYDKAVETNTFIDLDIAGREKLTDPDVDYDEKIAKDNQVVFYKDGEKITLDVSEYMYAGVEGLGLYKKELNNPLENATAKGIDIFKKLVTSWNPLFAVSNAAKDFGDALFHTRYNVFKYMGRYVQSAFRVTSKNSEYRKLWDAYRAMGGFQAGFYKGEIGAYDKRSELRRGIAKFTKALDALNDYIEQIPRFAEFVASVKAGNSYEKALYDAADVTTNFSRGGDLVKKLNRSWVPFLNPAVQGWSKMYRTWVDPMDRLSEKQINSLSKSTKGRMMLSVYGQLVMRALVLGIGAGLLNDLVFRWIDEDEDYAKLPLNVKENYYLIKTGDKFIKIPKSRVTSLWGMIGTRIVEYTNGNKDALNPWDWFTTAWGMVSPVDAASRHIASPIFDVIANRTWYGSEIESRTMEQMYEAKDRYDESTSSIAIAIGQALNVSPKKVHYVLDQYSGVLGDIILPMTTNKAEQDMVSARFVVDPLYTNNISNEYYDLKEELTYAKSAKDLSAMMALKYLNKCDNELSEIYQLKRDVANYNDLSVEEKKLLISTLRDKGLVDISGKETITDKEKREITDILQALLNGSLSLLTENVKTFEQIVIDEKFAENFSNLIYSDMYNEFDEKKKDSAYNKAMNYYYELYMAKMTDTKLKPKYALYGAIGANETSLYLTEIAKIESDKDRKGNTIAGSRKKKVQRYIQGLKLSAQQKNILLYLAGYQPTEMGQAVVRSYLLKQGYRAKEINDLWNN